ncbi:hypothetical protein BD626DRAFT_494323 [Schizophyllum amplum]|uniref:R3H domain-containing protein n=1 Tax=Schizophyllum amplum TaxID=97359 RepID=A0A550CF63_9AGAR|nr:hypothetical protein BD626DRAFT_494323 [Auriculariopsis ampla]
MEGPPAESSRTPTTAPKRRNPNNRSAAVDPARPGSGIEDGHRPRRPRRRQGPGPGPVSSESAQPSRRNRSRAALSEADGAASSDAGGVDPSGGGVHRGGRRRGGPPRPAPPEGTSAGTPSKPRPRPKERLVEPPADDLTSTLIHALKTPPYPDCPICFSSIHPAQPTWSCSPNIPVITEGEAQYCWTTFHLKCIRSWASKSVKEMAEAWRARNQDKPGDWRCPGCQGRREIVPPGYWCFCGTTPEPKPPRLATPHSCAGPCSRARPSGCGHACPLACHPGPCPPCQVRIELECYCPRRRAIAFRCSGRQTNAVNLASCGETCGRRLGCGKHTCASACHEGDCDPCEIMETVKCYCGKEEKEVKCGDGEAEVCEIEGGETWFGRFACAQTCDRSFDCGVHKCQKPCHPPSRSAPSCPFSPEVITRCPCGQHPSSDFPPRTTCSDPIPTCDSKCSKPHSGCDHPCESKCHTGDCPPCAVPITRPCRCGLTTKSIRCAEATASTAGDLLCDRPCQALRACGRHQCNRVCCPLAALGKSKGKKRRPLAMEEMGVGEERGGLHECDLVCGKPLTCGNHRCEERDHRGPCPPCLRSSFEEMICFCGRTVLDPPVPCGTKIRCTYQCPMPPPPCGHPRTQHTCHDDTISCPPCPFLTTKSCACGKKEVRNVRCSLEREKVNCGTACGKLMRCGFHQCERLCHAGECGECTAVCGKPRKLCLPDKHPCTQSCHAPAACPEDSPCQALVTLTCPCGRNKQSVRCGNCTGSVKKERAPPKCTNECAIAKRNARLADAFGIAPAGDAAKAADRVEYKEEVVAFGKANPKFVALVEKTFKEFIGSDKKTQVLPHMPPERRKFVHDLAAVYRMDTRMIDQEPHTSVQLLRRIDTRIPSPSLYATVTAAPPAAGLGKLANLRMANAPTWRAPAAPPATVASPAPIASPAPRSATPAHEAPKAGPQPSAGAASLSAAPPRAASRTPQASAPTDPVPAAGEVPDNWEDDV